MSSDTRKEQDNEAEALAAIFGDDFCDLRQSEAWNVWRPLKVCLCVRAGIESCRTSVRLTVCCSEAYPHDVPNVTVSELVGTDDDASGTLLENLSVEITNLAKTLVGNVMIMELAQRLEELLNGICDAKRNDSSPAPPATSFYERMQSARAVSEEAADLRTRESMHFQLQAIENERKRRDDSINEHSDGDAEPSQAALPVKPAVSIDLKKASSNATLENSITGPVKAIEIDCGGRKLAVFQGASLQHIAGYNLCNKVHCQSKFSLHTGMLQSSGAPVRINTYSLWWRQGSADNRKTPPDPEWSQLCAEAEQLNAAEFMPLLRLNHSNLLHYLAFTVATDSELVSISYLTQGSTDARRISHYVDSNLALSTRHVQRLSQEMLEALQYLHGRSVLHRFITPACIFETSTGYKLSDYFVHHRALDFLSSAYKRLGFSGAFPSCSFAFIGRSGQKVDVFLLGVSILAAAAGKPITPGVSTVVNASDYAIDDATLVDLLRKMVEKDENKRPLTDVLLKHSFLSTSLCEPKLAPPALTVSTVSEDRELLTVAPFTRLAIEFEVLQWLGRGGFGDVLKVRNKLDGRVYAIKRIVLDSRAKHLYRRITREVKLLSRLNHENIVRYYNSWIEEQQGTSVDESQTSKTTPSTDASRILNLQKGNKFNALTVEGSDSVEHAAPPPVILTGASWAESGISSSEDEEDSDDDDLFAGASSSHHPSTFEVAFENTTGGNGDHTEESSKELESSDASGEVLQTLYIQMEFCEKSTLRTLIDSGDLYSDTRRTWRVFRELVEGLAYVHQQGIIHRDLNPQNVFLDSGDHVKIGDFGLATQTLLPSATHTELLPTNFGSPDADLSAADLKHTGRVGTALYVAPELLRNSRKLVYTEKVDMYSLGIILFELFNEPFKSKMERLRVLSTLRLPEIEVPIAWLNNRSLAKVLFITRWLLSHEPSDRPSATELLSAPQLPQTQLEEREFLGTLQSVLTAGSRTRKYRNLMSALFDRAPDIAHAFVFDDELYKGTALSKTEHSLAADMEASLVRLFRCHAAVCIAGPLLLPKREDLAQAHNSVPILDSTGMNLYLPHDLRIGFARLAARQRLAPPIKRYQVGKVYRMSRMDAAYPKEMTEAAFDIVCEPHCALFAIVECVAVACGAIVEAYREKLLAHNFLLKLNHNLLLSALLQHCDIDESRHAAVLEVLTSCGRERLSEADRKARLLDLKISESCIDAFVRYIDMDDLAQNVAAALRPLTKRKTESASQLAEALRELEAIRQAVLAMKLPVELAIHISIGFMYNRFMYDRHVMYQVVAQRKQVVRSGRTAQEIIAVGGRYDGLVDSFKMPTLGSPEDSVAAVGISLAFDKLLSIRRNAAQSFSSLDALVCCVGSSEGDVAMGLRKQLLAKMSVCAQLWGLGARVDYCADVTDDLGALQQRCKQERVKYLFVISVKDPGFVRIRDLTNPSLGESHVALMQLEQTWTDLQLQTSDRDGRQTKGAIQESHSSSNLPPQSTPSSKTGTNLAQLSISFVALEKLAHNTKRRLEVQISNVLANSSLLHSISSREKIDCLACELPRQIVTLLSAQADLSSETSLVKSVKAVAEQHAGKHRKLLDRLVDQITTLRFTTGCANVIVVYSYTDDYYRLLMT